jgi:hypothetical protein
MIHLELSWPEAAITAGAVAVASVALRLCASPGGHPPDPPVQSKRRRLVAASVAGQETALVLGLFALWQYAGSFSFVGPGGALGRARWIWHAERVLHLPSETALQHVFLPYPLVIQFFNLYYLSLHFAVLIITMIWLFAWHRDAYRRLRTTLVLFTGVCLIIQFVPVAPPRMLPETGLVDTAILYHQSVYGSVAGFEADQLSAMPSVHVGWALLVAIAVIGTARTRWRWLVLAYPALTTLVVVVTANHFWADGIVAAALLGLVLLVQSATRRLVARRHRRSLAKTGLLPEHPTWDDLATQDHLGIGKHHDNSEDPELSRTSARRDRPA